MQITCNPNNKVVFSKHYEIIIKDFVTNFYVIPNSIQGLENDNVSFGVLKQLSLKYPNLHIEVTSEILPDVKVTGKSNFVIQNGRYIE